MEFVDHTDLVDLVNIADHADIVYGIDVGSNPDLLPFAYFLAGFFRIGRKSRGTPGNIFSNVEVLPDQLGTGVG